MISQEDDTYIILGAIVASEVRITTKTLLVLCDTKHAVLLKNCGMRNIK